MRMKALLALLGLGLALVLFTGCSDKTENVSLTSPLTGVVTTQVNGTTVPVANASVALVRGGTTIFTTTTNAQGQYSFPAVTQGSGYTVVITATNFQTITSPAFTVGTGTNAQNVIVTPASGTSPLTGTVTTLVNGVDTPVENATVSLSQNGGAAIFTTTTNAQGQYFLPAVTQGTGFTLTVTKQGFQTVTSPAFTVQPGTNTQDFSLQATGAGVTVSGEVGTTDQAATFQVQAFNNTGNLLATVQSGAFGVNGPTYSFTGANSLPIGNGDLLVATSPQHPGIITKFAFINVPAGGLTDVSFVAKTAAEIQADTADQIGQIPPAAGTADVVVYMDNGVGSQTITVGNQTSAVAGNPAFLTNIPASDTPTTVTINRAGNPINIPFTPTSGTVTVIRLAPGI